MIPGTVPLHGMDAAQAGFPASVNPHPHYSKEYFVWHTTWHAAMRVKAAITGDHRLAAQYEILEKQYRKRAEGEAL